MKVMGLILLSLISVSCNKSSGDAESKQPAEKYVEDVKDLPAIGEIVHATIRDHVSGNSSCEMSLFFTKYLQSKNDRFMGYAYKSIVSTSVKLPLLKKLDPELNYQDLSQIDESIIKKTVFDSNQVSVKEGDILIASVESNYDAVFALKILGDTDGCLDIEYKLLKFRYN